MADLSGDLPEQLALGGVQPELLDDFGGSLTAGVKGQIDAAIGAALKILDDWGIAYALRDDAEPTSERVSPAAIDIHDYEQGRPLITGERQ